jgi:AcrR family transcriptional regulator
MARRRASERARREQILEAAFRVAARDRLEKVTVRRVAQEADLSSGLVFFYFKTKDALLVALLDWLLERTIVLRTDEGVLGLPTPRERFLARLRKAVDSVARERVQVELFFDFWVMGTRHPEVREKLRSALASYREVFRPLLVEVLGAEPKVSPDVTAASLAAVCVSFVEGCAVQAIMDPEHFDVESFMACVEALITPSMALA